MALKPLTSSIGMMMLLSFLFTKPRPREVQWLAHSHTAGNYQCLERRFSESRAPALLFMSYILSL